MLSGCCLSGLASATPAEGCGTASFGASAVVGSSASCPVPLRVTCPQLLWQPLAVVILPMKQEERLLLLPGWSLWWHYPPELLHQQLLQGDQRPGQVEADRPLVYPADAQCQCTA